MVMHGNIVKFISKCHVAALNMRDGACTWSFCCFYVFNPYDPTLVFLSDEDTRHVKLMLQNPCVSGTISQQTRSVLRIRGIQFKGVAGMTDSELLREEYNKRFPFACVVKTGLWVVRLDLVKFTSNIIKFGEKLYWERVG